MIDGYDLTTDSWSSSDERMLPCMSVQFYHVDHMHETLKLKAQLLKMVSAEFINSRRMSDHHFPRSADLKLELVTVV